MRRGLLIGLAVTGALSGTLAGRAWAGTYTWQLPTSTAPSSANPDHDSYGAAPWAYLEATGTTTTGPPPLAPASFQPLGTFSTAIDGGLTGWEDTTDGSDPFIAANRSGAAISGDSGLQIPAGQLALQPAADRVIAIGWTSPLSSSANVSVSGSFVSDTQSRQCPGSQPTWALEQDGWTIASEPPPAGAQATATPQPFSTSTTISPGDQIYLVVGWYGVPAGFSAQCTTAGVTLRIEAPARPPPLSLTSPAPGARVSDGQPTFAGSSGTAFGDARTVTVRVWHGRSARGTPLEILSPDASSGHYSAGPSPPLPNGTYTVQAEQDDEAGDAVVTPPVSFRVQNSTPAVIAGPPALDRAGNATIPITCPVASGRCRGDVLVLTRANLRPRPDGPSGHVRVLFGYVSVAAGHTGLVKRPVPGYVAATLRHSAHLGVLVSVELSDSAGRQITAAKVTALRLTR